MFDGCFREVFDHFRIAGTDLAAAFLGIVLRVTFAVYLGKPFRVLFAVDVGRHDPVPVVFVPHLEWVPEAKSSAEDLVSLTLG